MTVAAGLARIALAVAAAVAGLAASAAAHPAPFSFLDLRLEAGRVAGTLTVHDLDAAHELGLADAGALLDPAAAARHGAALADLLARRLRLTIDGRPVAVTLSDLTPLPDRQALRFSLARAGRAAGRAADGRRDAVPLRLLHQTFVNVYEDGALRHQAILDARRPAMDYYAGTWPGVAAVLATFVPAGIHHIAIGPDHILFLVGLILLGGSVARLGLIVTAFTVGHSVTLSLAALGVVNPPGRLVEPAIALSLVLVGADNLLAGTRRGRAPRPAGADGRPVRAGPRLRVRRRAARVRPAPGGARLVAVRRSTWGSSWASWRWSCRWRSCWRPSGVNGPSPPDVSRW